ncbi:glutathione S-transferase family protein, partial [Ralstonia pseudosolanacearum]
AEALDIARAATPRALTETGAGFDERYGLPKGTRVTVSATDYAIDPVEGELVVSTRDAVGVLRDDPRVGQVAVHFPRVGYAVRKVEPAG